MAYFTNPAISRESLKIILGNFEVIPEDHRLKLWMTAILQLPNNKTQYLKLRKAGQKLDSSVKLLEDDKIGNEAKVCNQVLKSLFAHCSSLRQFNHFNLADFVEPFSGLLVSHELIYFEIMLTILVNWCQHWFDHIPLPPYTLLSMLDIIFLKNHPELYKHLSNLGIRAIDYAWRWLSTSFKTIVDPQEWLIVWDHILVNEPNFMYFIPLAACKLQSRDLMELSTHSEIMEMLHSTIPLDANSLLKEAYKMCDATPVELQLSQMHHFHPLIPGYYPTLNPTDLITFHSTENSDLGNLNQLLEKVQETAAEVENVIKDGMALRRWIMNQQDKLFILP